MATRKKNDIIQLSKIRMREELRRRLARDAERRGFTLNAEIVDRLERSYTYDAQWLRDAAIIDMMVDNNDANGVLLRRIAAELMKRPNWSASELEIANMAKGIAFTLESAGRMAPRGSVIYGDGREEDNEDDDEADQQDDENGHEG
jgi:hypothetical protein